MMQIKPGTELMINQGPLNRGLGKGQKKHVRDPGRRSSHQSVLGDRQGTWSLQEKRNL